MDSIFGKLRTAVLGNIHALMDKAVDWNSPASLKQYLRDLKEATQGIESEVSNNRYELNKAMAALLALQAQIEKDLKDATTLKNLPNPTADQQNAALALAKRVIANREKLPELQTQVDTATATIDNLKAAVEAIEAKEKEVQGTIHKLETSTVVAESQDKAAKALEAAGAALSNVGSADGLLDRAGKKAQQAEDRFNKALGGVAKPESKVLADLDAQNLLASL